MADSSVTATTRQRVAVTTIAGQELELLTSKEQELYEQARDKYLAENVFTAASDMRTLDRLVLFEVQVFRWQWQLAAGCDYDGVDLSAVEQRDLRKSVKDTEALISQIQNDLMLTKSQRDAAATGSSVGEYITNLKLRAREHGVRRDKQIGRAIELINELFAITGSFLRSNESERRKLGFETERDIVDYIWEVIKPQYDEVDTAYRKNQKMWVRSL